MKKNIMWFSRHEMTEAQKQALGENVEIRQVNKTVNSRHLN